MTWIKFFVGDLLRIRHHGIHQQKKTPFGEYVLELLPFASFPAKPRFGMFRWF